MDMGKDKRVLNKRGEIIGEINDFALFFDIPSVKDIIFADFLGEGLPEFV